MSLFFTSEERELFNKARNQEPLVGFFWDLLNRAQRRASSPGLLDERTSCEWWHVASEYLTDAAMATTLYRNDKVVAWLRDTTLSIARRPVADWVGPPFRQNAKEEPKGHLETAHLSWSLAIVLDLAGDVFSKDEYGELADALRNKGMALCRRWLELENGCTNWRCILLAGYTVAAAILEDNEALTYSLKEFQRCVDFFQPDGSYGESLQYGNYAMTGLVLTREALLRSHPNWEPNLPLEPYVYKPRWDAASLLYVKPLSGWGSYPIPRSVNFGDSAAIYRASADNLLHIAVRAKDSHPKMAGLARWLFEQLYLPCYETLPQDRASFGFINSYGFLTLVLLSQSAEAMAPESAGVGGLERFSCGNVISRSANNKTILAMRTGGEPLHAVTHLHADLNSFILVHNQERLLVDAGHSCYRNVIRGLDVASETHNTCTFEVIDDDGGSRVLQQKTSGRRLIRNEGGNGVPYDRGARLLLSESSGGVTVVASDASALYGKPIEQFVRFWLLCDEHVLFVVDLVRASRPVKAAWHWLLNNRDGALDLKLVPPDRFVARRGNAGMKVFHLGDGQLNGPRHGYMHDAYHPLPSQASEGKPGSGALMSWHSEQASLTKSCVHAICLDTPSAIPGWHLRAEEGYAAVIEDPTHTRRWQLKVDEAGSEISLIEAHHQRVVTMREQSDSSWKLLASQV